MKTIISYFTLFFICINVHSQEFQTYSNGLIYDTNTVNQLKFIVDSLNLKFKACEVTEVYYANPQAKAIVVKLKSGVRQAKRDLKNNISLEDFIKKYPNAQVSEKRLVVAHNYRRDNADVTDIRSYVVNESNDYNISFNEQIDLNSYKKGNWIYSKNAKRILTAYYLLTDFKKDILKDTYAEMIQYADCMIDTTSTKIKEGAEYSSYVALPENYKSLPQVKKEQLLDTLRSKKVYGMCSQDSSPRYHAKNIALLSAETVNWEVFLKAHLDIMNDRFDRMTDASYAKEGRKTYLKELEELEINTIDLILGIALRIDNASKNHYYGSIWRLGKALSESQHQTSFEKAMMHMIKDSELDDYNRFLIYHLYDNYLYHLNDCDEMKEREEKLKLVNEQLKQIQSYLPTYLTNNSTP